MHLLLSIIYYLTSRLPKPNFYAVLWRHNDRTFRLSSAVLPVPAYTLEALQNPYNRITYTSH